MIGPIALAAAFAGTPLLGIIGSHPKSGNGLIQGQLSAKEYKSKLGSAVMASYSIGPDVNDKEKEPSGKGARLGRQVSRKVEIIRKDLLLRSIAPPSPAQTVVALTPKRKPLVTPPASVLNAIKRADEAAVAAASEPKPSQLSYSLSGIVSWYWAPPGTCASRTLPFGTVVHVDTGYTSTTCVVADRGPYVGGRILDMSEESFSHVASPSTGLIWARISW